MRAHARIRARSRCTGPMKQLDFDTHGQMIYIGYCKKDYSLTTPLGWNSDSVAYHSDDGLVFIRVNGKYEKHRTYGIHFYEIHF